MKRKTKWIAAGAIAITGVAAASGIAVAGGLSDNPSAITGDAYDKASAAALASTGGGRVSETEVGDEESYYEVEVTKPDGSQVDVQLDEQFNVVGSKTDREGADKP
jgi:hypothetical protein